MKVQLIWIMLLIIPTLALCQNYELEWQSPPGANIPNALLDDNGYPPGALDFDGDGINELVTIKQISGSPVMVIINGANPQIRYRLLDENNQPFFPILDYKFRGFYDIKADSNKTLVMFAKISPNFVTLMNLSGTNVPSPSGSWSCDSLPYVQNPLTVKNMDGDSQYEIITFNPMMQTIQVWGEGYTPGLQEPSPPSLDGLLEECDEMSFEWVSPPNVSWPGNIDLLPSDRNDLNRDGNDDLVAALLDSFFVYSTITQSFLLQTAIPDDLQAAYENNSPRFIAFADLCGAPDNRYMIVGKPKNGNPNTPLNQLTNIAAIQLTTPDGDANPWLRDTYLYVNNLIINEGSNPENWKLRAITDMDNDGEEEIIMQNVNNRRIAMIGIGDSEGFTTLPADGFSTEPSKDYSSSGAYSLVLKLETEPGTEAFLINRNLYREAELDLNANGTPDLLTWQEAEGDTTAFGCKVFDLEQNEVLWSFDFPAGQLGDSLRVFHGFHDVNADGEKEVFLGKFTVITHDGTAHLPFGEDFRIISILDMDGDDIPDVLGFTADARLQVWGVGEINTVDEVIPELGFQASVYPNPGKAEQLQLKLSLNFSGDYELRLHDLHGRELGNKVLGTLGAGEHQIALNNWTNLAAGTYYLAVRGPKGIKPVLVQILH